MCCLNCKLQYANCLCRKLDLWFRRNSYLRVDQTDPVLSGANIVFKLHDYLLAKVKYESHN